MKEFKRWRKKKFEKNVQTWTLCDVLREKGFTSGKGTSGMNEKLGKSV